MLPVAPARRRLLDWYARNGRHDLPWRLTRDPYRVLVSEFMLQQTTVGTVAPYYRRFLKRFPTVRALARGTLGRVLEIWAGLGYYARARHLHEAARKIAKDYGGRVPESIESLRSLPGVGRYTAGAVRSLAFGKPAPILDGNVTRVLSRLLALRKPVKSPAAQAVLWGTADEFSSTARARDVNLALFDLGAGVCRPRDPDCPACPLRGLCRAHRLGLENSLPDTGRAPARRAVGWWVAVVLKGGRALIALRKPRGLFGGLWEFPSMEALPGRSPVESLEAEARRTGMKIRVAERLPGLSHTLTHRELAVHPFLCRWVEGRPRPGAAHLSLRWVQLSKLRRLAVSNLTKKIVDSMPGRTHRPAWLSSTEKPFPLS